MKKMMSLLGGWLRVYAGMIVLVGGIVAAFVAVHLLAGGMVREIGYALALTGAACVAAVTISLCRFIHRQRLLDNALTRLPEDPAALPPSLLIEDEPWHALAEAILLRERQTAAAVQAAQREGTDYYTLWLHQIKTPLAALDLMAQSSAEVDRPLMRQELLKIEQYAASALSYQRLQSISADLHLSDVPLYPLCCQVIRKLRPLFQYGKIGVTVEPFDDVALSDSKWLSFVLSQVLTNALKYTPAGGHIALTMPEPCVLEISDTGIGIRAEDVPRVFDRGFTGQTGRSSEKSTGIGLYLCRTVCDRLNHTITLTSTLGEGTSVRLDLRRRAFVDM